MHTLVATRITGGYDTACRPWRHVPAQLLRPRPVGRFRHQNRGITGRQVIEIQLAESLCRSHLLLSRPIQVALLVNHSLEGAAIEYIHADQAVYFNGPTFFQLVSMAVYEYPHARILFESLREGLAQHAFERTQ